MAKHIKQIDETDMCFLCGEKFIHNDDVVVNNLCFLEYEDKDHYHNPDPPTKLLTVNKNKSYVFTEGNVAHHECWKIAINHLSKIVKAKKRTKR